MIKIIKPPIETFVVACSKCGCTFTYELEDVDGFQMVHCPNCNNTSVHTTKNELKKGDK